MVSNALALSTEMNVSKALASLFLRLSVGTITIPSSLQRKSPCTTSSRPPVSRTPPKTTKACFHAPPPSTSPTTCQRKSALLHVIHFITSRPVSFSSRTWFQILTNAFFVHCGRCSSSSLPSLHAFASRLKASYATSEIHLCTSTVPSSLQPRKFWTSSSGPSNGQSSSRTPQKGPIPSSVLCFGSLNTPPTHHMLNPSITERCMLKASSFPSQCSLQF